MMVPVAAMTIMIATTTTTKKPVADNDLMFKVTLKDFDIDHVNNSEVHPSFEGWETQTENLVGKDVKICGHRCHKTEFPWRSLGLSLSIPWEVGTLNGHATV